ncbi:MAG: DMT family transporter [Rhodospirillales bacterium]|nr:DMT family transporter [Rhodospirillales bacterium]
MSSPADPRLAPSPAQPDSQLWRTAAPTLFVLMWSTGFIGAKAGLPYAEPMTFLGLRFAVVGAVMLVVVAAARAPWPKTWHAAGHIAAVGLLMHGVYLGGVFASIHHGLPAGISALIVGLQPLLTATVVGPLLGERVTRQQWLGLALGLAGVALVLGDNAFDRATGGAVLLSLLALAGITAGTLYQKRFAAHADLRTAAVIQYATAAIAVLALAAPLETMRIVWSREFVLALLWLSLVLSLGAVSLLYLLIRRGAAAKVASLFYMVPPMTAVFAWFLFGETLGGGALVGMAIAVIGVALVQRA